MSRDRLIRAAGCLLWRRTPDGPGQLEVALVHRTRQQDWSLPKGKLMEGEAWAAAAVREVAEETGHEVVLGPPLPSQHYRVEDEPKTVAYWAARAAEGGFHPNGEVDELDWLAPEAARSRLSYPHDADVLDAFLALHTQLGTTDPDTLVVLRHTKAVKRSAWAGPDRERPLEARGVEDADALVPVLLAFGISRLHASDARRCLETVAPYAAAVAAPVAPEPDLSEESYERKPTLAAGRTHALLESGGRVLVCSHRPVIPAILTTALGHKEAVRAIGSGLPPGGMVVIHHVRGHVLAVERHELGD